MIWMATVEEVLADTSQLDYLDDDIQYVIDEDLRTITIPRDGVVLGVQGDKNINRVNFQMPRYYNGFDMSEFDVRVNYKNANGDKNFYIVKDATVRDDVIYFTWLVDPYATAYIGMVQFVVRLFKLDEENGDHIFYTTHNSAQVLEGLMVDEQLTEEEYSDWSSKLQQELSDVLKAKTDEYSSKIEDYVNGLQSGVDEYVNNLQSGVEDYVNNLNGGINDLIRPAIDNYIASNNLGPGYAVGEWIPLPLHSDGTSIVAAGWKTKGVYIRIENMVYIEGYLFNENINSFSLDGISDLPFTKSFGGGPNVISNLLIKDGKQNELSHRFPSGGNAINSIVPKEDVPINIHISGCYTTDDEFESQYKPTNLSIPTILIDNFSGIEFVEGDSKTITLTEVVE